MNYEEKIYEVDGDDNCSRCGAQEVAMLFDCGWRCDSCISPMIIN